MRKLIDHPLPVFAAVALTAAALVFGALDLVRHDAPGLSVAVGAAPAAAVAGARRLAPLRLP